MTYLGDPHWSRDGRSFTTDGTDFKGQRALYRIDVQTGEISLVAPRPGAIVQWSPDEKKIYYRNDGGIVERDLATGKDRDLFRRRTDGVSVSITVSPDGRYIASVEYGVKTQTVLLIPTAGGAPEELLRANVPEGFDGYRMIWTPDGRAVVLIKSLAKGQELWFVPVTGEPPRKLDIDVNNWVIAGGGFSLDPDGRHVAFVAEAGKMGPEVWALENVLPAPVAGK
jgi:Tol biopolymer transport system component